MPPLVPTALTGNPAPHALVAFFSRALHAFQHSTSPFQVICTLPPTSPTSPTHQPPATPSPPPPPTPTPPRPHGPLIILDSSFNPPTLAHLHMATSALRANTNSALPARLLLLLSVQNADKPVKPASFAQRLAMMFVFAGDVQRTMGEGGVGADDEVDGGEGAEGAEGVVVDIGLTTRPYFHDKSRVIAESGVYPDGTEQIFLVGFDTLVRIFDEKYYGGEEGMRKEVGGFLGRARLRVMVRRGDEWGDEGAQRGWVGRQHLLEEEGWRGRVEIVEGMEAGGQGVSSTLAREAVGRGDWERLRALVTEGVGRVVREEGVYAGGE